ncbi:MAG: hypothetical protein C0511_02525 [Hyphomicrobium sp.]|nr:hypothetical protein [Hyphomicrobium sp.]
MMTGRQRTDRGHSTARDRASMAAAVALILAVSGPALAQNFPWPWGEQERRPVPREPVFRPAPQPIPGATPQPGVAPPPGGAFNPARSNICFQLEQRLVQESQKGSQSRDLLPKLDADLKLAQRTAQQSELQLERQDCYEYFLFSKSLRRTRQCVETATQLEAAKRRVSDLDAQRTQMVASSGRSFQDDIVRELARNNCGGNYAQEARKREGSIWQDDEGGGLGSAAIGQFGSVPYATYRTICVRLCDGYYFPISFSTLPNHFQRDADACQSKCAAPVELYYHQNPGAAVEQAVAAKSQEPYTKLKSAFRYRKEFVSGCSCKQTEFVPAGTGPQQSSAPADRRADAVDPVPQLPGKPPPFATTVTGSVPPRDR